MSRLHVTTCAFSLSCVVLQLAGCFNLSARPDPASANLYYPPVVIARGQTSQPGAMTNPDGVLLVKREDKPKGIIYVSQYKMADIWVYHLAGKNQSPFRSVPSCCGNGSLFVHGTDLYVGVESSASVQVFHKGALTPYRIINCPDGPPFDLAVDKGGNTYVSEGSEVRKYVPGDDDGKEIGDPNLTMPEFVAADNTGDVFVAGEAGYYQELDWLPAHTKTWKNTGLGFGAVRIDKKGDLVITSSAATRFAIVSIPTFTQIGSFGCPGEACLRFNFTEDGRELWTVDQATYSVYGISFPSGVLEDTISEGLVGPLEVQGVAVSPGLN
jgi:hypothetical protein